MIKFGTSGFRGIIADNFTKENVQKVAFAIVKHFKTSSVISIGFDNRFMGKEFAKWLCEVLCAYGKKVKFFNVPVPSPLIAFETKNAELGIMITASHNPYVYNGIKIFQHGGKELTSKQNECLEKTSNKTLPSKIKTISFDDAIKQKKVVVTDNVTTYVNQILKHIDRKVFEKNNIKIVFNVMNGSALDCAKKLFNQLNVKVGYLNEEVNPNFHFGLPAPYEHNLKNQIKLAECVRDENFSFALDGDGDRISFIGENGEFYDCNYVSALIYDYYLENGIKTDIVKNCAATALLDKIAEKYGQKVICSKVGFKNVAEQMEKHKAAIGAESNGIAFSEHILYKDGLFCAVKLAEIVTKANSSLGEMIKNLKKKYHFPCCVKEYAYPFTDTQREKINQKVFIEKRLPKTILSPEAVSYDDGLKIEYPKGYWAVIRFSGNENVIRLFTEMPNNKQAEAVIADLEKYIGLKERQK